MVRILVEYVAAFYAEHQERGGKVHPNGGLQKKQWGSTEFATARSGRRVRHFCGVNSFVYITGVYHALDYLSCEHSWTFRKKISKSSAR